MNRQGILAVTEYTGINNGPPSHELFIALSQLCCEDHPSLFLLVSCYHRCHCEKSFTCSFVFETLLNIPSPKCELVGARPKARAYTLNCRNVENRAGHPDFFSRRLAPVFLQDSQKKSYSNWRRVCYTGYRRPRNIPLFFKIV